MSNVFTPTINDALTSWRIETATALLRMTDESLARTYTVVVAAADAGADDEGAANDGGAAGHNQVLLLEETERVLIADCQRWYGALDAETRNVDA